MIRQSAWVTGMAAVSFMLFQAFDASAGRVVLNIKVVNPSDKPQTKEVVQHLPQGLGTSDIISLDGMELGFDIATTSYFVRAGQELGPKQSISYEVEVNDVWTIPATRLVELEMRAGELCSLLAGGGDAGRAAMLKAAVTNGIRRIARSQAENDAGRVGAGRHIEAFLQNSGELAGVTSLLTEMEDIAAAAGYVARSPSQMVAGGDMRMDVETVSAEVQVLNFSTNESRVVRVVQYLPAEVVKDDILDAGGLQVQYDDTKGAFCLIRENVELKPGESKTYNVIVRDRWNVNKGRIESLKRRMLAVWEKCRLLKHYESIEPQIAGVVDALKLIEGRAAPRLLDQWYVDFYKTQAADLYVVEEHVARIELLAPGDNGRPPARYAWYAIYTIAGFLALLSLATFLRASRK
ncbi:MAG: hypothetical protein WCL44_09595 [bacterium]